MHTKENWFLFFCFTVYNKSVYMWVSRLVCGDLLDSSAGGFLFAQWMKRNYCTNERTIKNKTGLVDLSCCKLSRSYDWCQRAVVNVKASSSARICGYIFQNWLSSSKLFCITNPQQIAVVELERYSRSTCSKQPRLVDCRIGVVNKLDRRRRRRVLLTTRSTCRGEMF